MALLTKERKRLLYSWSRTLHIYLSMFSFWVLLFFAVTGITLNHPDWLASEGSEEEYMNTFPVASHFPPEEVEKEPDEQNLDTLAIIALLKKEYHAVGNCLSLDAYEDECIAVFKRPGTTCTVTIDFESEEAHTHVLKKGTIAIINALHQGRDSGAVWKWVIDISAALMILVSMTGLIILFSLRRSLRKGLWTMTIGGLLSYGLYYFFVP